MKTKINIILGFLGSGKTSFINSMLEKDEFENETIVIIQDEYGETEIKDDFINSTENQTIIKIKNNCSNEINPNYISNILTEYSPNRLLIEANGMKNSSTLIDIFRDKTLKKICKIDDIITIINGKQFFMFFRNLKNFVFTQVFNSETIILNNTTDLNKKEFLNMQKEIKAINETAQLIEYIPNLKAEETSQEEYIEIGIKHKFFILKILLYMCILILCSTYLITLSISDVSIYNQYILNFKRFYTIFISILIQGLPFILVGSFVSAVIQIYISQEIFIKIFRKNIFLSCIIAAFSGLLFPICDCGTIPIVKSLIKKKIPIGAGITFMLAAPIVNPIAIISTMYAFQGMKSVVICRIVSGIIIAILIGLIMNFLTKKDEEILNDNADSISCNCGWCNQEQFNSENKFQKIKSVFIHTGEEFFNTGKFMIIGTFLSSIFQIIISLNNNIYLPNDNRSSLIFMILLSFTLSVCSTSDAFIAKGFLKQFSINSVMGFLVVGPMLDIKNTIMLFGNFKKKFVFKLIFLILSISFNLLININLS